MRLWLRLGTICQNYKNNLILKKPNLFKLYTKTKWQNFKQKGILPLEMDLYQPTSKTSFFRIKKYRRMRHFNYSNFRILKVI
jgi:hypothetical protein